MDAVWFLDATSADGFAATLASTRRDSLLNVVAIFVTGRAAHPYPYASIEERDDAYSAHVHLLNTKRMKQFLRDAGRTTKVFMGQPVAQTRLRTVIPHRRHVDEHVYDLWNAWENTEIDGDFTAGLEFLQNYQGEKLLVLVGGPLTEVAFIQHYRPDIAAKFGTMFIQAGDFADDDSTNLIGGKGNAFNGACDPGALNSVLFGHKGDAYILPSNKTKQAEMGFPHPDEIADLGVYPPLATLYRVHYEHSAKRRGTHLFIHDLGLVMLAEQDVTGAKLPYAWQPVQILEVPTSRELSGAFEDERLIDRRGTIVVGPAHTSNRYVVVWQETNGYRRRATAYLQS